MTSFAINDGYVRFIELGIGWFHFGMNREENSDGASRDEGCSICSIVKAGQEFKLKIRQGTKFKI